MAQTSFLHGAICRLKYKNLVVSQHFLLVIRDFLRRQCGVHGDQLVAHLSHGIHQKRYMADMVKMRMSNEDMIDPGELPEVEIAHPGACVNQNIIIQ